jgi:hypothetical protein
MISPHRDTASEGADPYADAARQTHKALRKFELTFYLLTSCHADLPLSASVNRTPGCYQNNTDAQHETDEAESGKLQGKESDRQTDHT